jgi:hypothetical protein
LCRDAVGQVLDVDALVVVGVCYIADKVVRVRYGRCRSRTGGWVDGLVDVEGPARSKLLLLV